MADPTTSPTDHQRAAALALALGPAGIDVVGRGLNLYAAVLEALPAGVPDEDEHIHLIDDLQPLLLTASRLALMAEEADHG